MANLKFRLLIAFPAFSLFLLAGLTGCKKERVVDPPDSIQIAGTAYHIVTIGSQTWTDANYQGPGGVPYGDGRAKPQYGKYYSYAEVQSFVLPAGWRVPSMADFIRLGESQGLVFTNYVAAKQPASLKLVSTTNWLHIPGNNQSGFNAHPAGYIMGNNLPIDGDISEFWTAEGNTFSIQEGADLLSHRLTFYANSPNDPYKFNVRFVRDN